MMQSNNREYIGRNEFWTPSTIGLTQSMIDNSINNISLKDNSSELFTVENNKIVPSTSLTCENPEEDNEVANKEYVDTTITSRIGTIANNFLLKTVANNTYLKKTDASSTYLTKSNAESTYAKKSDLTSGISLTSAHFYVLTSNSSSWQEKYIKNITTQAAESWIEVPIPTTVTGNVVFITVKLNVSSRPYSDLFPHLFCSLNRKKGSTQTTTTNYRTYVNFSYDSGQVSAGTMHYDWGGKLFSFTDILTDLTDSDRSVYLHFYLDATNDILDEIKLKDGNEDNFPKLNNEGFYIAYNKNVPEIEVTAIGLG